MSKPDISKVISLFQEADKKDPRGGESGGRPIVGQIVMGNVINIHLPKKRIRLSFDEITKLYDKVFSKD